MVCAPVRSIIPSLKLGDYLSVQAHNPCSISHILTLTTTMSTVCFLLQIMLILKEIKSHFKGSYDKQNLTLRFIHRKFIKTGEVSFPNFHM